MASNGTVTREEEAVARQEFCRKVLDELGSLVESVDIVAFGFEGEYFVADISKGDKSVIFDLLKEQVYEGRWYNLENLTEEIRGELGI
ncbi:MAG: hypothetical protein ACXAEN_19390 [Candidatus Thorarchaeota archaeon]|jgi:hypothetical protein